MKYTKEERLEIGRQVYEGQLTRYQAAEKYGISDQTARDYMRLYRDTNALPPKKARHSIDDITTNFVRSAPSGLDDLKSMSKDELIMEIIKARINEERLKKGYEVKGDGSVIRYAKKNIK